MSLPANLPPAIRAARVLYGGEAAFDLSTAEVDLFPQVYFLLTFVADEVHLAGASAPAAVEAGLAAFRRLLAVEPVLTEARQAGLFGELWLLARTVHARGQAGLDSWVGPLGQPHDFRLDDADIEVKTTTGDRRVHPISSLTQLLPSPGRPLYLLSLGFQPAPGAAEARSLRDAIEGLRHELTAHPVESARFDQRLVQAGWREETRDDQLTRFVPRLPARLVTVNEDCPRLIPAMIEAVLPPELSSRLSSVGYRVDLEGLGVSPAASPLAPWFESAP
jgi:hypothetical protein